MSEKAKIYCFTKYSEKGPSSRYRTFQYIEFWKIYYSIELNVLLNDWYFDKNLNVISKGIRIIASYLKRYWLLQKINKNDLLWIEYELFPYVNNFAEEKLKKRGIRFIIDYDDAIFNAYIHNNNKIIRYFLSDKIFKIMKLAHCVVTGSPYLSNYALKWNKNVCEIPTSVNISEYNLNQPQFERKHKETLIIGWLGSQPTSINLSIVKEAFTNFIQETDAELWLMGYDEKLKDTWLNLPVKFFPWSKENEKSFLNSIDVGIMPLHELPYNHGKCGFKLIQYMAMGKPTISTPMEANIKIDRLNINYFATESTDWLEAFRLIKNLISTNSFLNNRLVVKNYYSTDANAPQYLEIFNKALQNN